MKFFIPFLTLLFIGLKLTGYIAWSWWWVLSPYWISLTAAFVIVLGMHYLTKVYGK
jgi:hypothetical protein